MSSRGLLQDAEVYSDRLCNPLWWQNCQFIFLENVKATRKGGTLSKVLNICDLQRKRVRVGKKRSKLAIDISFLKWIRAGAIIGLSKLPAQKDRKKYGFNWHAATNVLSTSRIQWFGSVCSWVKNLCLLGCFSRGTFEKFDRNYVICILICSWSGYGNYWMNEARPGHHYN